MLVDNRRLRARAGNHGVPGARFRRFPSSPAAGRKCPLWFELRRCLTALRGHRPARAPTAPSGVAGNGPSGYGCEGGVRAGRRSSAAGRASPWPWFLPRPGRGPRVSSRPQAGPGGTRSAVEARGAGPYPQAAARPHPGHHDAIDSGQQMIMDPPRCGQNSHATAVNPRTMPHPPKTRTGPFTCTTERTP